MKLELLKSNALSKEELLAIKAGASPDCEEGNFRVYNGLEWVCVPEGIYCEWVFTPEPPL